MSARIARGHWQAQVWDSMESSICVSPVSQLRGKAKRYSMHYRRSFNNLLLRAKQSGYTILRVPGVRGGECTATYQAIKEVTQ